MEKLMYVGFTDYKNVEQFLNMGYVIGEKKISPQPKPISTQFNNEPLYVKESTYNPNIVKLTRVEVSNSKRNKNDVMPIYLKKNEDDENSFFTHPNTLTSNSSYNRDATFNYKRELLDIQLFNIIFRKSIQAISTHKDSSNFCSIYLINNHDRLNLENNLDEVYTFLSTFNENKFYVFKKVEV